MKQIVKILIFLSFLSCDNVYSAFEYNDLSARGTGMCGAYSVVGNDADVVFYNTAQCATISRPQLVTMYQSLYPGVMDSIWLGTVVYSQPVKKVGVFGFDFTQLSSNIYSEQVVGLLYSRSIDFVPGLALGMKLKSLSKQYGSTAYTRRDPTFGDTMSSTGYTYDLGVVYKIPVVNGLRIGVSGSNLNQPSIGIKKRDIVPSETRVGVGYVTDRFTVASDLIYCTNATKDTRLYVGTEKWLLDNSIGLRCGFGYGNNSYSAVAVGMSYRFRFTNFITAGVDYSYTYQLNGVMENSFGNNYFSFLIKF